jgi:L-ribulokinase
VTLAAVHTIGLDYGTNSVRALLVNAANGAEVASAIFNYENGTAGVVLDGAIPDLARQHPGDYVKGFEVTIRSVLADAKKAGVSADSVVGVGVDTTGSTPIPVDASGQALALLPPFVAEPAAMAWLWKDHTAHAEATEITVAAEKLHPEYLAKCGGTYSSEWFWSKILRCARANPRVSDAAYTWVEAADWIPAVLAGNTNPATLRRGICAAGHKAMFNADWGGYPDADFLGDLHPTLSRIRESLPEVCYTVDQPAGKLSEHWAKSLGLTPGIAVAVGAFDAHLGAVGAGIGDYTLVKIIGTSTCDIMVSPQREPLQDIEGLCGIVPESVLPGYYGLEAGQSAVGDIFNWFVNTIQPGRGSLGHAELTQQSEKLRPGQSGLLTLDWHNGNRTILVDQRLTGLTLGTHLQTTPAEIYRSLIEATAFGARVIMERFEEGGVPVKRVINCGGIAARNPMAMQIYADVMNRPLNITRSLQTCALGSAIAAAVVAGAQPDFASATAAMAGAPEKTYTPIPANVAVYEKLYRLYKQLHDAFGKTGYVGDLSNVMKELLTIRDAAHA